MNLEFQVNKPLDFVFEYLSNMQKFAKIHPVIYKIEHLEDNQYKVFEKLPLGFFSYSFTYPVKITAENDKKRVLMQAKVMNLVGIEILLELEEEQTETKIKETVSFESLLPVEYFAKSIFEKTHRQLFANLEKE